jgi:hypothetical protein
MFYSKQKTIILQHFNNMLFLYGLVVKFWELVDKLNDKIVDDVVMDFFEDLSDRRRQIRYIYNGFIDKIREIFLLK